MQTEFKILDHGYIKLVETWGSDERIVEAARMSTDKGFLGWGPRPTCKTCGFFPGKEGSVAGCSSPTGQHDFMDRPGDEKLLAYLWKNKHATPFEMAGAIVEVKAPLMVFREWHRHRTQSYNEMSARYIPIPDDNYAPTPERCLMVSGKNKQAGKTKDANDLTHEAALEWLAMLNTVYEHAEDVYRAGLKIGIPKELARLSMTVGRYSKMRASANLRNWLAFLTLRSTLKGPNAQWEIRQYADALGGLLEDAFPRTWALFAGEEG